MLQKVQRKILELNMVNPGDMVLIGVSGGADSVGLLAGMHQLSKEMGFSIEALHVEHGIRGEESLEDARFVQKLCESLGVACYEVHVDVPSYVKESRMGLEEAARKLRYEFFAKMAKEKNAKVALAHHMEDDAETILFQMVRGSGITGLCGMKAIRQDADGVTYIRPFLQLHKQEILDFLKENGLEYRTDSSNLELDYSRNFLRNKILPDLQQINVQTVAHIHEAGEKLAEAKDFIDQEVGRHWDEVVETVFREDVSQAQVSVDVVKLNELHSVLQKEILLRAVDGVLGQKRDITSIHIEGLLSLSRGQSGKEISLPGGLKGRKDFQKLLLFKEEETGKSVEEIPVTEEMLREAYASGEPLELLLNEEGQKLLVRVFPYEGNLEQIPKKPYTKWFDYDMMKRGFFIRNRCSGDYFISDKAGHRKKLKEYFIEEKIPVAQREKMWLLASEHLVLWLIGGRISEHLKVTEGTTAIVEIEYQGGKNYVC